MAGHYFTSVNCNIDYDKPYVVAMSTDELREFVKDKINYPVLGLYSRKQEWIVYDASRVEVLLHEYIHHLASDFDDRCLHEVLAQLAERVYHLETEKSVLRSKIRYWRHRAK